MELAKKHRDRLSGIKKRIEKSAIFFKKNNERFHEFQKFVFETAITPADESSLDAYGKPVIEFNITNAPISRLCGEFSKQEPSIYVSPDHGSQVDPQLIEVIEGHIRHILFEAKKYNTQYNVYRDSLSGGFSAFKVWTEYAHEMSMDQVIRFGRVWEPTLMGFDPMAREVDKSDAEYCFELFPMSKEEFKNDYPDIDISEVKFIKGGTGFNWSYDNGNEDVVILVDYYEKKKVKKKIVKIADGRVMTMDDYDKFIESWNEQGLIEQPPIIVGEPRWTSLNYICRYRLMETEILEYKETSFKSLPIVFVDGDSVNIKEAGSGSFTQFTKPYVFHAKGIQRLVNFSGQVIANDFETMVMHKFKVAVESLPEQEAYQEAYVNVQKAQTLMYQAFSKDNPGQALPPPQEIARVPLPNEVLSTFNNSMQMLQNILGSYDAALGINDNQLSGVAIVEAATQSNAAAMPYIVNYMQSLNQVAQIIVDMIPKCYVTPRTIPVVGKDGKQDYIKINQPGGPSFNYDENALTVKVEAGVNFAIAKNKALQQIISLMQASPLFAQFINTEGLDVLLDNMEFRGVDVVKEKADSFMQKMKAEQEKAQSQPNPEQMQAQMQQQIMQQQMQIEQQKLQLKDKELMVDSSIKSQRILIDKEKADNDRLSIEIKAGESQAHLVSSIARAEAEEMKAKSEMKIAQDKMEHAHLKDAIELHHKINKDPRDGR